MLNRTTSDLPSRSTCGNVMGRWVSASVLVIVGLVIGISSASAHEARSGASQLVSGSGSQAENVSSATQTTNWSGQIETGSTFSYISAEWVVPTVQQNSGASATWVGIGGSPKSPNSSIRVGTSQVSEDGVTSYSAWYQVYPQPVVTMNLPVYPGEVMLGEMTLDFGDTWTLRLADTGPHHSFDVATPYTYSGPDDSAEYIEELPPSEGAGQARLANFGSVTFTSMASTPLLGTTPVTPIDMVDSSGSVIASTGGIFNYSFTDTYGVNTPGYWLVGSDGGIFNFGAAQFYGSTGSTRLQRPVVGIVPTADQAGYWLDASDGGVFSYGDTQFYGSIPGIGLHPAGSGVPKSLNAPIVGMVPSTDDGGYFMVASDGGVFAFGDAHFAGSCPGIGGCQGTAVAVMPDASGQGYWLVTSTGNIYSFGDARFLGAPGHGTVTSAVATPDGSGYWILLSDGQVFAYGDAANDGSPPSGSFNALNPATAVFRSSSSTGYWVTSALGSVYSFGDAPYEGGMNGSHLNGPIVAAAGS